MFWSMVFVSMVLELGEGLGLRWRVHCGEACTAAGVYGGQLLQGKVFCPSSSQGLGQSSLPRCL